MFYESRSAFLIFPISRALPIEMNVNVLILMSDIVIYQIWIVKKTAKPGPSPIASKIMLSSSNSEAAMLD